MSRNLLGTSVGYPVVLVNVPNDKIRSLGLVTATIAGKEQGSEFAAVFSREDPVTV